MMWLFSSLFSLLADNLIFSGALGTSTLMAATKNRSNLVVLSLMMTVFSVLGCLLTAILYHALPLDMVWLAQHYLIALLYIAVISVIYLIVLLLLYASGKKRAAAIRKYVHLSAFNCAVMGTLYLCFSPEKFLISAWLPTEFLGMSLYSLDGRSVGGAALFGLQTGLGFLLASLILLAVRKRLYDSEIPESFRGFPAVLVYIGLFSMAIYAVTI